MIEIVDLSESEITDVLDRVGYGHLACCQEGKPYVVPVHYAFEDGAIYIYTTEGKKADIITVNPAVCLQVERVVDNRNWESVIVEGIATRLPRGPERDKALESVVAVNPTLTPAVSIRWLDEWVKENIEVIYRVTPTATSGRRSLDRVGTPTIIPQSDRSRDQMI